MPKITKRVEERQQQSNEIPDGLRPYNFHGLALEYSSRDKEAHGQCPFCSKENKFSVNVHTGQWRCWSCGGGLEKGGGGILDFLRLLWEHSDESTSNYSELQKMKGLEYPDTLMAWGMAKSVTTGHWIIPAFIPDPKDRNKVRLQQLYKYTRIQDKKGAWHWALLPTPAKPVLRHGVFGLQLFDRSKEEVFICEGPWDGARWWEALKTVRTKENTVNEYVETASPTYCLLADANVIAMPGCTSFVANIRGMCEGKTVYLLYDSDYPGENPKTGMYIHPAGFAGAKRAAGNLLEAPSNMLYLCWGDQGYDPDLPDGYDVRDALEESKTLGVAAILDRLKPIPEEWTDEKSIKEENSLTCVPCDNWKQLIMAWRKALKWTPGLNKALACMLASVASTNSVGDQLWLKIIGPPSCGKSTLSEALSVNRHYVLAKSTIRGFHSGYREGGDKKKDNSLIPLIMGRTFVLKDGDTLLQSPALGQILSEARDLYDSVSRSHFKNNTGRDYEGIRMTWLLCGTSSLRTIDSSELGQRFLDCVIMEKIDPDLEDEILIRQAYKASEHATMEVNPDDNTTHYSPELLEAMQLTGGYVSWLRENAYSHLNEISLTTDRLMQCKDYGKFVSFMRSRPSNHQNEEATRELAARLVSQHVRLARFLALVLNKKSVDQEVIGLVRQVAMDTGRGIVLQIARLLYGQGRSGLPIKSLHLYLNCTEAELRKLLRFLRAIDMVEHVKVPDEKAPGIKKNVWRLTLPIQELCERVGLE